LRPSRHGVCSTKNGCGYTPVHLACAQACDAGVCVGEPCAGVFCDRPQAPACTVASHLRVFESVGVCSLGACSYQSTVVECPGGCNEGVCAGNLCAGVSCTAAPAASCIASNVLRVYEQPGSCAVGACRYQPRDVTCAQQCSGGACVNDPCAGVSCEQPPVSTCVTAKIIRTFAAIGTCQASGACEYPATDSACPTEPKLRRRGLLHALEGLHRRHLRRRLLQG